MTVTIGTPTKYAKTSSKKIEVNHTCGADTTMLIALVYVNKTSAPTGLSCVYGTTSMTKLVDKAADTEGAYVAMYYLLSPPTAVSKTVTASWTLNDLHSRIVIFDVYGSDGIPTNATSAKGTTNTLSLNVTSTTSSIVIEGMCVDKGSSDGPYGAGQNLIVKKYGTLDSLIAAYSTWKTGEATTNMAYTLTDTPYWAIVAASIAGYTTPPVPPADEILPISEEMWMPKREVVETDEFFVTDTILGGNEITDVESRIYLGTSDKTYTNMLGTGQTYADTTYTTNKIKGLKGGNIYVLISRVTIDGKVKTRKCEIHVQKESSLP